MITQKQLLCTFSNNVQYTETLKEINKQYHLIDGKIFVFANEKNLRELYLTFNVVKKEEIRRYNLYQLWSKLWLQKACSHHPQ